SASAGRLPCFARRTSKIPGRSMIISRSDRSGISLAEAVVLLLTLLAALAAYRFYNGGGLIWGHQYIAQQIYNGNYFYNPHIGVYLLGSLLAHVSGFSIQQAMNYVLS